eukprot:364723-Chlamydomonas_euryale.AAC.8
MPAQLQEQSDRPRLTGVAQQVWRVCVDLPPGVVLSRACASGGAFMIMLHHSRLVDGGDGGGSGRSCDSLDDSDSGDSGSADGGGSRGSGEGLSESIYFPAVAGPLTLLDAFVLGTAAGPPAGGSDAAWDSGGDAAIAPGPDPYPVVQFSVPGVPPRSADAAVLLCGSLPELGSWRTADALRLSWSGSHWVGRCALPVNAPFEAKVVRYERGRYDMEPGPYRTLRLGQLLHDARDGRLARLSAAGLPTAADAGGGGYTGGRNGDGATKGEVAPTAAGAPLLSSFSDQEEASLLGGTTASMRAVMITCYWGKQRKCVCVGGCKPRTPFAPLLSFARESNAGVRGVSGVGLTGRRCS